jgi:catechol 2,3-dioxygenase-like lactoylglutathione lyase family enzyme
LTASVERPRFRISATVLGSDDAQTLAGFYQLLLGWERHDDQPGWVRLRHPSGDPLPAGLSFQEEVAHVRPVWPAESGDQQMQAHLDIAVDDLAAGVEWAIECGATLADHQPRADVRVMLDPAGHPFCLFHGEV